MSTEHLLLCIDEYNIKTFAKWSYFRNVLLKEKKQTNLLQVSRISQRLRNRDDKLGYCGTNGYAMQKEILDKCVISL